MLNRSDNYDRRLLAEIYDQTMTNSDDVGLLKRLLGEASGLEILECFAGTGRIALPLLQSGHYVTGLEIAQAMAERAVRKAEAQGLSHRLRMVVRDALGDPWGEQQYDVVVVGSNSLFELAEQKAQEECLRLASAALKPGGHLFLDNNNWTSPLSASVGSSWTALEGTTADGTYCRQDAHTIGADESRGLLFIRRSWYARDAQGVEYREEYDTVKRPVSGVEVCNWLQDAGFTDAQAYGDFAGAPFSQHSERAIFWARK